MSAWTPELKEQIKNEYLAAEPTAETSQEIVKEIADNHEGLTANGIRLVLIQAGVYVKKEAAASASGAKATGSKATGEGSKRVSKEDSINALKAAITAKGGTVEDEILDKLTGKAAVYFTSVINSI